MLILNARLCFDNVTSNSYSSMRVGHYLRVAWLLTELVENFVFPRKANSNK